MNILKLKTDQNVPINVELASVGIRLLAVLVDMIILGTYVFLMGTVMGLIIFSSASITDMGSWDFWLFLYVIVIFIPFLLYTPLLEYFTKGQTLGKMIVGIRVTKINGENASFKEYFTRWLFRPYEAYLLLFAFGGILLLIASLLLDTLIASISSKNQRFGDFMANTVVVRQNPLKNYSLHDLLLIKSNKNYTPQYSGITIYTDEDMLLVKNVISRVEIHRNEAAKEIAITMADKIAGDLQIEIEPNKKFQFLKTVLTDYIVLTR